MWFFWAAKKFRIDSTRNCLSKFDGLGGYNDGFSEWWTIPYFQHVMSLLPRNQQPVCPSS